MSAPIANVALTPPGVIAPAPASPETTGVTSGSAVTGPAFADVLSQQPIAAAGGIRFSRHALDRLQQRGIDLNQQTLGRLTEGVSRASGKGSRNSVVFVGGTAFVVSVSNNTVITAVGAEHMQQHVFTNIDSAVIA